MTNRKLYHLMRVSNVCRIVDAHYEPGNYSKSYYQIWRKYVLPVYPMCYRTLLNYVNTPVPRGVRENAVQLSLF